MSGRWCYLYRGIDQDGNLDDVRLSEKRDMLGTKAFFEQAKKISQESPEQVFTDGLTSYPRAIDEELGEEVEHQVTGCQGNPVEKSHRSQKYRYYPTLGIGDFDSAQRFFQAYDEVNNFLRPRDRMAEFVSLIDRRQRFIQGVEELASLFYAA